MSEVDWILLGRHAAGECTDEEHAQVEALLARLPQYRAGLEAIQRVTVQSGVSMSVEERAQRFARLRDRRPASRPVSTRRARPRLLAAAVVLLAFGGTIAALWLWRPWRRARSAAGTMATARGESISLRLADGTIVLLGPSSTLNLAATYERGDRTVMLDGEAEFVVTHDEKRPFTVRTEHFIARDLGTRFLVRAYADEPAGDVVVTEGSVRVTRGAANAPARVDAVVKPGQRARVTSQGQLTLANDATLECCRVRTDGRLTFRKTPLREVVAQVARWRDVVIDLNVSTQLGNAPFIGAFEGGMPTADVVRTIGKMYDLQVSELSPRRYRLRAR